MLHLIPTLLLLDPLTVQMNEDEDAGHLLYTLLATDQVDSYQYVL